MGREDLQTKVLPELQQIGASLETGLGTGAGFSYSGFAQGGASIVLVYADGHAFEWPATPSGWERWAGCSMRKEIFRASSAR